MAESLTYAPTPPRDRAEVVWQGDEFTITIPPQLSKRAARVLAHCLARAALIFLWVLAAGSVVGPLGRVAPAVCMLLGAWLGWRVVALVRQARTWARVTLRNGMLIVEVPALMRSAVTRYRLSTYAAATLRPPDRRDFRTRLVLHRGDNTDEIVEVLDDVLYAGRDLATVAAAIGHAMRGRTAL